MVQAEAMDLRRGGASFAIAISSAIKSPADPPKLAAAEARELAAWAAVSLGEDPERSLILGLYAWEKQAIMVPGLAQVLHSALLQSQTRRTLRGHQDYVRSVKWSPDGSKLATASRDETARVWDSRTGSELLTLQGHRGSEGVADLARP